MTATTIERPQVLTPTTDADRWQAVCDRSPAADGHFVFSVRSTGVYCRPSCAARRPRRENVRFHASPADAERAGFRPCKRCRPAEAPTGDRHAEAVTLACRTIETAEDMPNLDALASAAGLSRFHFHRVFKQMVGLTPKAYAAGHRAKRARDELATGESVTQAIYGAGFNSSGRFYAAAPQVLGMTPTQFRRGGRGATVRFAVGECSLGSILVAATASGICAISIADTPDDLVRALQDRFRDADLVGGDTAFEAIVAKVVALVEAPRLGLDLPLDVRGSAFQQRVWAELRRIPAGETRSYAQVAAALGDPKAVRAVAGACAANTIAVAIPCHRVVRTDGALSGYRWGVERKRALLEREQTA